MTIIDAHHHIWRRADLPWLLGPTQPRIFGAYDGIKRDYLIDEFRADIEGTGVTQSVYVQANWSKNWFLDEAAWVSRVHDESGWPHAISAYCDMTQEDARRDLDKLAAYPLVRAIRHQMHHHHNPLYRFAPAADTVGSDAVIKNVSFLAHHGFAFELQIFAEQTDAALRLIEACPDVTFILQHAGMLEDRSNSGRKFWRSKLSALAERPNVVCKISGLGTFLHQNDPSHVAWVAGEALGLFGADRCLYGSNFPIEKLWTDYRSLFGAVTDALGDRSEVERAAVLGGTAARVYGLTPP